jgi:hypothetical protein
MKSKTPALWLLALLLNGCITIGGGSDTGNPDDHDDGRPMTMAGLVETVCAKADRCLNGFPERSCQPSLMVDRKFGRSAGVTNNRLPNDVTVKQVNRRAFMACERTIENFSCLEERWLHVWNPAQPDDYSRLRHLLSEPKSKCASVITSE